MIRIIGIIILTLMFTQVVKNAKADLSPYMGICGSVLVLCLGLGEILPIFDYFNELCEKSGYSEYSTILIKALGISVICQITSDMCRDFGENQLGGKVEFIGKCEIMMISLPVIKEITEAVGSLLK